MSLLAWVALACSRSGRFRSTCFIIWRTPRRHMGRQPLNLVSLRWGFSASVSVWRCWRWGRISSTKSRYQRAGPVSPVSAGQGKRRSADSGSRAPCFGWAGEERRQRSRRNQTGPDFSWGEGAGPALTRSGTDETRIHLTSQSVHRQDEHGVRQEDAGCVRYPAGRPQGAAFRPPIIRPRKEGRRFACSPMRRAESPCLLAATEQAYRRCGIPEKGSSGRG